MKDHHLKSNRKLRLRDRPVESGPLWPIRQHVFWNLFHSPRKESYTFFISVNPQCAVISVCLSIYCSTPLFASLWLMLCSYILCADNLEANVALGEVAAVYGTSREGWGACMKASKSNVASPPTLSHTHHGCADERIFIQRVQDVPVDVIPSDCCHWCALSIATYDKECGSPAQPWHKPWWQPTLGGH